jgi:hypothetical protein
MVKHTRANDLIKTHSQVSYMFDIELVDVKILESMFFLELLRVIHTGCAAVDASHLSLWPPQHMLSRLGCPASCDQYGLILLIKAVRPKNVKVRSLPFLVLPLMMIFVQAIKWRRIRIPIVKITYLIRCADHG